MNTGATPSVPTVSTDTIFHIGTLDEKAKGVNGVSFEGDGLSISICETHADNWRSIARLGGAPLHTGTKDGGFTLVDAHALNDQRQNEITAWLTSSGHAQLVPVWLTNVTDEQGEVVGQSVFRSLEEAENETHDPDGIFKGEHLIASAANIKRFNIRSDELLWGELATVLWVEHHAPELDGVFWNDKNDPSSLSSPRGVIHRKRMPSITWNQE